MHFEKTMCDRLGYKYKDIFSHLEFILNKMNNLLNNYGCGLSDKELEMLSQLFLKLETGKIEIIEFTKPIEKYLDVDEMYKENKELKKQLEYLRSGEYYNQLRFENEMLQQVVDTNGVPSEVYDYIDCTHRNTELLEENQKCKEVIDKAIEILKLCNSQCAKETIDILKEVE